MSEWRQKRFWKAASAAPQDGGWGVALDGRWLKTPAKAELCVPTQSLAEAIATEWDAQEDEIDPLSMPFTRSANAAIDKVSPQFDEVAALIAAYGETDLTCYRAEGPDALRSRQAVAWDPLLNWAAERYGVRLSVTSGIIPMAQPGDAVTRLSDQVHSCDAFALTALHDLVSLSGSLVIGLAAISEFDRIEALWDVSRIDETWQEEQWGRDEEATEAAVVKREAFLLADRFYRLARLAA